MWRGTSTPPTSSHARQTPPGWLVASTTKTARQALARLFPSFPILQNFLGRDRAVRGGQVRVPLKPRLLRATCVRCAFCYIYISFNMLTHKFRLLTQDALCVDLSALCVCAFALSPAGERGVRLTTSTGDFAEWHELLQRGPSCPPRLSLAAAAAGKCCVVELASCLDPRPLLFLMCGRRQGQRCEQRAAGREHRGLS